MTAPPEKESARPLAKDEQDKISAQIELCKAWLRASPQARRELLQDVKFAHPQLWIQLAEGTDQ